jgi:hypothetical protein
MMNISIWNRFANRFSNVGGDADNQPVNLLKLIATSLPESAGSSDFVQLNNRFFLVEKTNGFLDRH